MCKNAKRLAAVGFTVIFLMAGVEACGPNPCEQADDQMIACGIKASASSGAAECAGADACRANCTNSASCEALVDAWTTGMPSSVSTGYLQCMAACK